MENNSIAFEYCNNSKCEKKNDCKRYMQFLKNIGVVENFNHKTVVLKKFRCTKINNKFVKL